MDKLIHSIVAECACRMGIHPTPDDEGLRANIELRIRGWLNEVQGGNHRDHIAMMDDPGTYLGRLHQKSAGH